jgi:hypothetical protein
VDATWLRSRGKHQYEPAFQSEATDAAVLPDRRREEPSASPFASAQSCSLRFGDIGSIPASPLANHQMPRDVLAILGVAAKLEHRRIKERSARGRADAKAKGVKFGRKPKLTPHQREAIKRRDVDGETLRSIARSYNVSPQTISRLTP